MADPQPAVTLKEPPHPVKVWLKGLLAAAIGAFTTALSGALVEPHLFWEAVMTGDLALLKMAGGSALVSVLLYLKKSPLPGD